MYATECARTFKASPAQGAGSDLGGIPSGEGRGARAGAEDLEAAMAGLGSGAPMAAITRDRSPRVTP